MWMGPDVDGQGAYRVPVVLTVTAAAAARRHIVRTGDAGLAVLRVGIGVLVGDHRGFGRATPSGGGGACGVEAGLSREVHAVDREQPHLPVCACARVCASVCVCM